MSAGFGSGQRWRAHPNVAFFLGGQDYRHRLGMGSVQQSRSAPYLIFLDESLRAASDYSVPQAVLVPHGAGSSKIVVQPDASNIRRELDPMSKWLPRDGGGPGIEKIVGRYFFRAEVEVEILGL